MTQDTCGCCEGSEILTPLDTANRPGLNTLAYRVGTHATFLETMKARLASLCISEDGPCDDDHGFYPLQKLTTRDNSDPAIALLDAWATVGAVLTFYQERIANEGYLPTATERRSILELAQLVGYRLQPGVAASVYLAFMLETSYEDETVIPAGTRAQSVPGPGELPQSFETAEPLRARTVWNHIKARLTQPYYIIQDELGSHETLRFQGTDTNLRPNDRVFFIFGEGSKEQSARRVQVVDPIPADDITEVTFQQAARAVRSRAEDVLAAIEEAVDLERAGVTSGQMVNTVVETLHELQGKLRNGMTEMELETAVADTLDFLAAEHERAIKFRYERIKPWLADTIARLEETAGLSPISIFDEAIIGGAQTEDRHEPADEPQSSLAQLVEKLNLPPSEQPPNARNLDRSAQALYSEKSDIIPKLITSLFPRLQKTFYPALAQASVSAASPLKSVAAPRVKASLFGYNAPLKPIYSEEEGKEGVIVGYEEWPLTGFVTAGLSLRIPGMSKSLEEETPVAEVAFERVDAFRMEAALDIEDKERMQMIVDVSAEENGRLTKQPALIYDNGIIFNNDDPIMLGERRVNFAITLPPRVRFLNTVEITEELTILIDGEPVTAFAEFAESRDYVGVSEGKHAITIELESGDTIYEEGFEFSENHAYTLVFVGDVAAIRGLLLTDDVSPIPQDQARIRFINAHPDTATIDVIFNDAEANQIKNLHFPAGEYVYLDANDTFSPKVTGDVETEFGLEFQAGRTLDLVLLQDTGGSPPNAFVNRYSNEPLEGIDRIQEGSIAFDFVDLNTIIQLTFSRMAEEEASVLIHVDEYAWEINNDNYAEEINEQKGHHQVKINWEDKFITDRLPAPLSKAQRLVVALDALYEEIVPGSWVYIEQPDLTMPDFYKVVSTNELALASFGLTGKVTQLTLDQAWLPATAVTLADIRPITVYAQPEPLTLAEKIISKLVEGASIELDGLYEGLETGRWIIVSGERADLPGTSGVKASELVMIAGIEVGTGEQNDGRALPDDSLHTRLLLANDLAYTYKRDTVTIYANVVKATHGETRREVLGGGDAGKAFQTFTLKQKPLTYLSAPTPAGVESTLTLRVNDIAWPEVESLVWLDAGERGFITKRDNEDVTAVIFGDGTHGARLPTGAENIAAEYRNGLGEAGNVDGEQIRLLATRPLGVKSVINPLPATGGADRESRDQARRNAPLAVMALDRLVSVQDYADFARAFAGIAKASATKLTNGRQEIVHLTIAGANDIPIATTSDLYLNLQQALQRAGDPYQAFEIAVRELSYLFLWAEIRIHPDYLWEKVATEVQSALLSTFSFENRQLGQDVLLSEVLSVIQGIPGVVYVDVEKLTSITENEVKNEEMLQAILAELAADNSQPPQRLPVRLARLDRYGRRYPAQLAFLSPDVSDTLVLKQII